MNTCSICSTKLLKFSVTCEECKSECTTETSQIEIECPAGASNLAMALEMYLAEDPLDDYECER